MESGIAVKTTDGAALECAELAAAKECKGSLFGQNYSNKERRAVAYRSR